MSRRVFASFRKIVAGVFTPVLAKPSKSSSLVDGISVGVDRMQPNFEPMERQVEAWRQTDLTDVSNSGRVRCGALPSAFTSALPSLAHNGMRFSREFCDLR